MGIPNHIMLLLYVLPIVIIVPMQIRRNEGGPTMDELLYAAFLIAFLQGMFNAYMWMEIRKLKRREVIYKYGKGCEILRE